MPVIVHDEGMTFSSKFEFEVFLWVEHPSLTPSEIEAELALSGDGGRQWPDVPQAPCDLDEPDRGGRRSAHHPCQLADRLAAATVFLDHVRTGGGRCGCRVICKVDFNAQLILDAALLGDWPPWGSISTIHALDVETPETAAGMRRFLAIMNDPPWKRAGLKDPTEEPEPDADGPP